MSDTGIHVLIIGTGITGLVCAQGLRKNNIKVTLWESAASISRKYDDDWGIGIYWAIPDLTECLPAELLSRVKETQVDPHYDHPEGDLMPLFNGETGEVMKTLPLPKMHRVARTKMRSLCSTGLSIEFNKTLAKLELTPSDTIKAYADGFPDSPLEVSHVLGADGAHSKTRSLLLPDDAKSTSANLTAVRMLVNYPDAAFARNLRAATHPINTMAIHPRGIWGWISMLSVPDPADPAGWTFQLLASWPRKEDGPETVTLDQLKKRMEVFGEPFRAAFQAIPPDTKVRSNQTSYWEPPAEGWSALAEQKGTEMGGRVQLAGDAAHPMTFHRGQGLNHAVADAAEFVRAMIKARDAKGDRSVEKEVVAEYERAMVKRGGEEVRISYKNTVMLHNWEMVMESPLMKGGIARSG